MVLAEAKLNDMQFLSAFRQRTASQECCLGIKFIRVGFVNGRGYTNTDIRPKAIVCR